MFICKIIRIFIFNLLLHSCLAGQNAHYTVEYIDAAKGMGHIRVDGLVRDHFGRLWVGSRNGLYVYNGLSAAFFTPAGNPGTYNPRTIIIGLAIDHLNNIWVSSDEGLVIINPETGEIIPEKNYPFPEGIYSKEVLNVAQGTGQNIWFTTKEWICAVRKGKIEKVFHLPETTPAVNYKIHVTEDEKKIYFYSLRKQMFCFSNNKITNINYNVYTDNKDIYTLNQLNIAFLSGFADTAIMSTEYGQVFTLEYRNGNYRYLHRHAPNLHQYVAPWAAVQDYVDDHSEAFILKEITFLYFTDIKEIAPNTWAVLTSYGLFLVKKTEQLFAHFSQTTNHSIRGITSLPNGNLLIGSYSGLLELNSNGSQVFYGKEYMAIWDFLPCGKDSFFIVSETIFGLQLLIKSSGDSWVTISFNHNELFLHSPNILKTRYGLLAGRSATFLYFFNPLTQAVIPSPFNKKMLPRAILKSLYLSSKSELWAGGEDGLWHFMLPEHAATLRQPEGLPLPPKLRNTVVNCIYEDRKGLLWIGTGGDGLYAYNPVINKIIDHWTTSDGLPDNNIYSILSSNADSILWLGTKNGLSRMETRQSNFLTFYATDGLGQNEFNTQARYKGPDGTFYFGGINGVSFFKPDLIKPSNTALTSYINLIITNYEGKSRESLHGRQHNAVTIQPRDVLVEIYFRPISVFQADQIICRYRIKGLQEQWKVIPLNQKLTLMGLKPDNYQIEYQLKASNASWGPVELLQITVLSPWYQTAWFFAICFLTMSLLGFLLFNWRVNELRKTFEMRKSIADDLHDSLGSRLYLLKALANKIAAFPDSSAKNLNIQNFEKQATETLQIVRDFIWAFDPQQDSMKAVVMRFESFAENFLRPVIPVLEFTSHISDAFHGKLSPQAKHHLQQAYQEILTNMVKHTETNKISIRLTLSNRDFCIAIKNFHSGYRDKKSRPTEGKYGLESLTHRLKSVNAAFSFEEVENQQQTVTITVETR